MREIDYSHIKPIIGLALLALLVRIIYLQIQGGNPLFATPSLDELYHYQWAMQIAQGDWIGDRAFFRAPLYSYLLGIIFWVFGPQIGVGPQFYIATLLQHIAGVAACVLIYFLTLRLFNRRGVAFTAMGLAALYAPALFFEGQLLDISLQTLLLPLALLLAIHAFNSGRPLDFLWLGLAGGVAIIARPASLPWFILIAALSPWLVRPPRRIRRQMAIKTPFIANAEAPTVTLKLDKTGVPEAPEGPLPSRFNAAWAARLAAMGLGLILPILPVTWHNFKAEGVFVPVATYAGINFWIGNNASADGFTSKTPDRFLFFGDYEDSVELFAREQAELDAGHPLNSAEVQSYWFRRGRQEIFAAPIRWIGLMFKKSILFWNAFEIKNNKNIYVYDEFNPVLRALLYVFNFGLIMPFGLAGMFLAWRRSDPLAWRLTTLLLFTLFAGVVLFFVNTRYRFPFAWLMLPFAAAGMAELVDRIRALRPSGKSEDGEEAAPAKNVVRIVKAAAAILLAFAFININFFGIRQSQNLSEDYWTVANAWQEIKSYEEALLFYKKSIELNREFSDAYNGLGETYYQLNNYPAADDAFQKALNTAGNDRWAKARALNNLGVTAEARGLLDQAEICYQQSLDIAPEHALAWQNMGDTLRKKQKWDEACNAYNKSRAIAGDLPLTILGLAACEAHAGNSTQAINLSRQYLATAGEMGLEQIRQYPELTPLLPQIKP